MKIKCLNGKKIKAHLYHIIFPHSSVGKDHLQCRKPRFDTWVGKIPWRRDRLPTPVFSLEKSYAQRSLVGYSSLGCKESDMTKHTTQELQHCLLIHRCFSDFKRVLNPSLKCLVVVSGTELPSHLTQDRSLRLCELDPQHTLFCGK